MRAPKITLGPGPRNRVPVLRTRWGVVLLAARIIVALLAFQASSVPHVLADVFVVDAHAERSRECPEDDDDSCPPGCPSCHVCGHVQATYVPPALRLEVPETVLPIIHHELTAEVPPSRARPPFFRPPRA